MIKCLVKNVIINVVYVVTTNTNGYEHSEVICPECDMKSDDIFYYIFHQKITNEPTYFPSCFE